MGPVSLGPGRRQPRCVILTACLPGGMVDASPFREDHLATQIPGIEHTDQPDEAKNGGSNSITWTGQEPEDEGDDVEDRRTCIEKSRIEANSPLRAIGIAPVRQPGHKRTLRSKKTY